MLRKVKATNWALSRRISLPVISSRVHFWPLLSQASQPRLAKISVTRGLLKFTDNSSFIFKKEFQALLPSYLLPEFQKATEIWLLISGCKNKKKLAWNVRVLAKKWTSHFKITNVVLIHFLSLFLFILLSKWFGANCYFLEFKELLTDEKTTQCLHNLDFKNINLVWSCIEITVARKSKFGHFF